MKHKEMREVEVKCCDICGEETASLDRCAICKRDLCFGEGGARHSAFAEKIYRYGDGMRLEGPNSKVCHDCAGKKFDGTLRDLFNEMMGVMPVSVKD